MENKRRRWLIALFAVALFCGTVWFLLPAREPRYQGQPLSHWLFAPPENRQVLIDRSPWGPSSARPLFNPGPHLEAEDELTEDSRKAIEAAGTDAIPTLLRMLRAKDSDLKLKLLKLAAKQHFIKIQPIPALFLNFRAREGFALLGPKASNAVPALIKICDENISESSHLFALDSLGWIGPSASNAIPALLRGFDSTNARYPGIFLSGMKERDAARITSLWSLGMIHQRPDLVIPAVIKALQDTNRPIGEAAVVLHAYGPEARAAVEPCMADVKNLDTFSRSFVFYALVDIAPDLAAQMPEAGKAVADRARYLTNGFLARPEMAPNAPSVAASLGALHLRPEIVVPALTTALQDHNINIRREAANALAKFGQDARPAIPALQRALSDTNQDSNGVPVSVFAARALKIIDLEAVTNADISNPGRQ